MENVEGILQRFIENLRYEVFQKGLDSVGVIDKIEINNRVSFQRENSTNERECGLEDWYTILQTAHRLHSDECLVKLLVGDLTEFRRHAESWLAGNCDGNNIREFLQSLTNDLDAVIRYISGDNSQEVERTVRGVIEGIENIDSCISRQEYKDALKQFVANNGNIDVRRQVRTFLRDVLNSIFGLCLEYLISGGDISRFKNYAERWASFSQNDEINNILNRLKDLNTLKSIIRFVYGIDRSDDYNSVRNFLNGINVDIINNESYREAIYLWKCDGEREDKNIRRFLNEVLESVSKWIIYRYIGCLIPTKENITEFRWYAESWLAGNCDDNIGNFLQSLTNDLDAVIRYIGGDNSQEVERTVRGVIEGIENIDSCISRQEYKDALKQFVANNGNIDVRRQVRTFLRDVLNSIFAWIRSRYSIVITYNILSNEVFLLYFMLCLLCGCGGNESLILGKLHHLIEGVRRGTIKQHEFCERVREIVDMMPYSEYFKKLYLEARLCDEGTKGGNQGAENTLCQGCDNIFYIANNCEACYRCCASTLRRNSDDNIEIYRAEINGRIRRIYPYEEDYKRWEFTGKVWFYLRNDGTNRGINDRILMGIMQIIYYSPDRGSFGSILLEFEPDRNSQNGNSVSGIFRGRYIKLMRHEGNVWHVRANTFPVEWLPQNRLCEYLERNSLLRQLVNC